MTSSRKIHQLELDAVFRPRIDTRFSPKALNDLEMGEGGSSKNPIVLDEEDKANSPLTTPLSQRHIEPRRLLGSCPFENRIENVPDVY